MEDKSRSEQFRRRRHSSLLDREILVPAIVESFNGRMRDECLNLHWFRTVDEARATIRAYREDYNVVRPHSALGYRTPLEFGQCHEEARERQRVAS